MDTKPVIRWGRFALGALVVAWFFDFLFFKKPPGISIFIFIILTIGMGLYLLLNAGIKPAGTSLVLLIPILFFSAVTFLRQEMLTQSLSFLAALLLLALFAVTFTGGRWIFYNLADYVVRAFRLFLSAISRLITARRDIKQGILQPEEGQGLKPALSDVSPQEKDQEFLTAHQEISPLDGTKAAVPTRRRVYPVLRGVFLALPVLAILASLLASADPVFSRWLEQALSFLKIEKLAEYIFRGIYILIGAYLLTGIYLHAAQASQDERVLGQEKAWVKPFLGTTEASIVLGSVVALFAVFVVIQFEYFFGGQSNINTQGFTYSEYARRGFGELVAVALISLALLLGLSAATRRTKAAERQVFTIMSIALVGLVLVILVSAFQRVTLYESAYGFSRLRTYTHVFIIWLALLLAAALVLELAGGMNRFALVALVAGVGFVASLSILNVDALIVRQNVRLAQAGHELDAPYLASLSDDAVPSIASAFQAAPDGSSLKESLGVALVCHARVYSAREDDATAIPWQGFHLSRQKSLSVMALLDQALAPFTFSTTSSYDRTVSINNQTYSCFPAPLD